MQSLANHFLIAMPSMLDPAFKRTVTFICEHNEKGAMGLVINQPVNITVGELLDQIDIDNDKSSAVAENTVFSGGPVQNERGFVLHSPKPGYASSQLMGEGIMMTTSKDVLAALTTHEAPSDFIITLGYAGWGAGQLEQELAENSWLTIPAHPDIIFKTPSHQRWEAAANQLGVDINSISCEVGHA